MTSLTSAHRALSLMERVLRNGAPLAAEYPLVFEDRFAGRIHTVEVDGDVRSTCASLVRDFVVGDLTVRCGLIGSVATDPDHRQQGLATRVLQAAERELASEGCVLAMLWADDPAFYEARGWRPIGCEVDYLVTLEDTTRFPAPDDVRAAAPDDRGAIHRLYSLGRQRIERSPLETGALLAGPGIETLVIQRERDIIAYSCLGRGADFAKTVHEWAGSPDDLLRLLRAHAERAAAREDHLPIAVMTPIEATDVHAVLDGHGLAHARGVLGLARPLDITAGAALLGLVAGPDALTAVDDHGGRPEVSISGPDGEVALDGDALLDVLFSAGGERRAAEDLGRRTGLRLDALPVPIFAWGLDSI